MMSVARRCDLPPRSGTCLGRWPIPTGGSRGAGGDPDAGHSPPCSAELGRTRSWWSWTPALGARGPRSRTAKAGGSVFCISKLTGTPASLSLEYLRSPNGQHRAHQLSWLPQEPPGTLPLCRLSSSQPASLTRVFSTAEIRVKAMPRQHMPASSPHSRIFPGRFCAQQSWGRGFDSSLQGRSIRQALLPCTLI